MTSKTFKTAHADNKVLKVDKLFGNPRLLIKEFDGDTRGFAFAPSDAPALALAILEAAGVKAVCRDYESYDDGSPEHLQAVMYFLKQYNEARERVTAEAKERAELEAEALELLNAEREEFSCTPVRDLSEVPARDQRAAIAVARRAREMRAEK